MPIDPNPYDSPHVPDAIEQPHSRRSNYEFNIWNVVAGVGTCLLLSAIGSVLLFLVRRGFGWLAT